MRIKKVSQVAGLIGGVSNTYSESTNDAYSCDYVNGTVLYENASGSNNTITLSDSVANYSKIVIYSKDNDSIDCTTCIIENPNGKKAHLIGIRSAYASATSTMNCYIKSKDIIINGTSIINEGFHEIRINTTQGTGNGQATTYLQVVNNIYITKVIGYN